MESVSPERSSALLATRATVLQVCSFTVYSLCPLTVVVVQSQTPVASNLPRSRRGRAPATVTVQAPTASIDGSTSKLLCAGIEHTVPDDPKLRSALLQQLCTEHGGNHKVLARYLASPVPRTYCKFRIGADAEAHRSAPLADCTQHQHLFDPDGNLHCVTQSVSTFGSLAGLPHPKNLGQVLNGSQAQCNGRRTELELIVIRFCVIE